MDTLTLHTIALGVIVVCQVVSGLLLARYRTQLAKLRESVPADVDKRLAKLDTDVTVAIESAKAAKTTAAQVRSNMLTASSAARQLAVELERGAR